MMLTHRPFAPQDAFAIAALPQTADELFHMFPDAEWPLTAAQVQEAAARRWDATVVERDGEVVAYANFVQCEPEQFCALGNVVVAPRVRRQGVGRFLVRVMAGKAFDGHGVPVVRVAAHATNRPALQLYAALGFKLHEIETVPHWQGGSVPLFRLRLAAAASVAAAQ